MQAALPFFLEVLRASAASGVSPVLLQQPVIAAKSLVEPGRSSFARSAADAGRGTGGGGTEVEIALIGVFLSVRVKPCVQIGIGDGFFQFMRNNAGHAIGSAHVGCRAVGTGTLGFAAAGA